MISRRLFAAGLVAGLAAPALAQPDRPPLFSSLRDPHLRDLPAEAIQQRVTESIAAKADNPGRWIVRAPLPLPRSEMGGAVVLNGRLHLIGGYAEQRVDRPYHQVYDPATEAWSTAAPLPRGANHVGVAVLDGRLYAIGGHLEQNRKPDDKCFVYEAEVWREIAPLPIACGAAACVGFDGFVHAIGGAIGETAEAKRSVDWHLAYDPKADRWAKRAPLPTGRDHTGTVVASGLIHVTGGRVDNFHTNSNLHHTYDGREDRWTMRAPLPTARSGHGAVLYRDRIFVLGGEGSNRVFGQNEGYDLKAEKWLAFAPLPTPRHGFGAGVIGDFIHLAGGGPMMGGAVQSAVHDAFSLA